MMLRQKSIYKCALVVVILTFFTACSFNDRPHPSDEELLHNFSEHEQEFERLVAMCNEDANMIQIAPDFIWRKDNAGWPRPESEWGITRERWDAYRELLVKLNLRLGVRNYQPHMVFLVTNEREMVNGGSSKGYAYITDPPKEIQIQDSLDNFVFNDTGIRGDIAYRPIKNNWYIFLDFTF